MPNWKHSIAFFESTLYYLRYREGGGGSRHRGVQDYGGHKIPRVRHTWGIRETGGVRDTGGHKIPGVRYTWGIRETGEVRDTGGSKYWGVRGTGGFEIPGFRDTGVSNIQGKITVIHRHKFMPGTRPQVRDDGKFE